MTVLLAAALIAGLPQSDILRLCHTARYREVYLHEPAPVVWEKAWASLSFNGVDLRPEDKREIREFCSSEAIDDVLPYEEPKQ